MSFDNHKNFAYSLVATSPSPLLSGTTLSVTGGDGSKFPTVPFNAFVWPMSKQPLITNCEIVRVTDITGDTFTITRSQESSTAQPIDINYQIAAGMSNKTFTDIESAITTLQGLMPTGTVVGTTDTQVLTNKTLNSPVINTPTITSPIIQGSVTGWNGFNQTLTYVSSTSLSGTGFLAQNQVGDKFWSQQSIPLTSYWPLISNVTDTKSGYNGTATDITYTSGGKFGNAATFNGTTSKVVINDTANLKPTGSFTIEGWIKPNNKTGFRTLFQSYSHNTNANGFYVRINDGTGYLSVLFGNNEANDSSALIGNTDMTSGGPHHFVISFQSNITKMFVDGILQASGYFVTPTYASTNYIRIGCHNNAGTDDGFYSGQIGNLTFINGYAADITYAKTRYALTTDPGTANITANYYGYVTTLTDTLLTLTGGADYALYNGPITSPYYSHSESPVGFPGEFEYAPIPSGLTSPVITYCRGRFYIQNRVVNVDWLLNISSWAGQTGDISITPPITIPTNPFGNGATGYFNGSSFTEYSSYVDSVVNKMKISTVAGPIGWPSSASISFSANHRYRI